MLKIKRGNPDCAKTNNDNNFPITGQAKSSIHLSGLEYVSQPGFMKTERGILLSRTPQSSK